MISGVISVALSHSGCKYNLQLSLTSTAYFSAQSKSDLLKTTIFNSFANGIIAGRGALNFFGDKQIQSHLPLNGCAPEVSIFVFNPADCNSRVNSSRLCIKGSPPVITTISAGVFFTSETKFSISIFGCISASQLSFTSHHTQPTSHPPRRIKYAAFPW